MLPPLSFFAPEDSSRQEAMRFFFEIADIVTSLSDYLLFEVSYNYDEKGRLISASFRFGQQTPKPNPDDSILRLPLDEFFPKGADFRERQVRSKVLSRLRQADVFDVRDLLNCTEWFLRSQNVPQFGDGLLAYVQECLAARGLSLRQTAPGS